MKIGILVTKHTEAAFTLFKTIASSLKIFGDTSIYLNDYKQYIKNKHKCDCFLGIGWYNEERLWAETIFRRSCYFDIIKNNKKVIIIDTGYLKNSYSWGVERLKYISFGINGYKGFGQFYNKNSPSNRFEQSCFKIKPWRKFGSKIIVTGQNLHGTSVDINIFKWHVETIKILRETTDKTVIFREHPRGKKELGRTKFPFEVIYSKSKFIHEDLDDCWAVVGYSTNALCEVLLEGIPIFSLGKAALTYKLGNNTLENINKPKKPEREQFFYDLMYCHWTLDEIRQGLWWAHLRPNICK